MTSGSGGPREPGRASLDASAPQLVLAGRSTLSTSVRQTLNDSGLASRILVRQDVDRNELADLYRGAFVYLQTSQEEGFGMSVIEAMASGLPVAATDTAGARECVIDGTTGWLVRQDSEHMIPMVLAERVRDILAGSGRAMAVAARERCQQTFSVDATLARLTAVYDTLLTPGEPFPLTGRPPTCGDRPR